MRGRPDAGEPPAEKKHEPGFNKVLTATDARGKVTDYAYDPVTGDLASVTAPAATSGGTRPQTTVSYTSFTGAGGMPSFTMPTSVTSKIDAANSVTTTTAYNAANKYVPQSSTVDPTGLNLTSTFSSAQLAISRVRFTRYRSLNLLRCADSRRSRDLHS
ncbi:MAG: hypothetical protein H6915_08995 [Novosphingobium sp.]|nr:hypothetical protein [Novosphingobium sp.]MCP5389888.1 hypothetical protein [Novosphingobium sp.]